MNKKIDIKKAADLLGINPQTLRRWDESKRLAAHRDTSTSHRYYHLDDIENFLKQNWKYLYNLAEKWSFEERIDIPPAFYCQDAYIFKSRLDAFEENLKRDGSLGKNFPLVTSVIGEIGNNSFDHNIGNWPRIPGIFFGYDLKRKRIVLIDKGQGVFRTLKNVKKDLVDDKDALRVAFTEIISGRLPENRGNGLKYVKKVIESSDMSLYFHSGKAIVLINNKLNIMETDKEMLGCLTITSY